MKTVDGKPSGVWMDITRLYWFLLLVIRERKAERQRETNRVGCPVYNIKGSLASVISKESHRLDF